MIGVLVATHGNLGSELIKTVELIQGNLKGVLPLAVDQTRSVVELKKEIGAAVRKLDQGKGVLILTDLFGGTPSNIALSFLKQGKVEVITGVNLPMMLKLSEMRENLSLNDFAAGIRDYGMKNIYLAGETLNKKVAG